MAQTFVITHVLCCVFLNHNKQYHLKLTMLGVNARRSTAGKKEGGGERRKGPNPKKGLKVVYISSPMKVETSAAEFRTIVQELTGRHSDVARLMDSGDWYRPNHEEVEGLRPRNEDMPQNSNQSFGSSDGSGYCPNYLGSFESDSPSESDSLFHDMGMQHRDVDFYTSNLFQDSALLEALGSFDSA